ncbi:MAG: hypothetical protein IPM53_01445 [Anaerolineaceae bacterium]|nr:hypothetical protein [Anaerolineaceae bacterium]
MTSANNNFVILSTQRSGSTWLVDVLDKSEDASVYGELFMRKKMKWLAGSSDYPQFGEVKGQGWGIRPFSVFTYLNNLYAKPGAVGFKLMYSSLYRYPEILLYLWWHRIRVVHLIRKNLLDVQISTEMARTSGQWHLTSNGERPQTTSVYLSPDILVTRLKRLQAKVKTIQKLLRWFRLPHLEITYEALLENASRFESIWRFLSLNPPIGSFQTSFSKIRQASYVDEVRNYEEVKQTLQGTEFAIFME